MSKKTKNLNPTKIAQAEYERSTWKVVPAEGVTHKDMLENSYWVHVGHMLRPGHHIEAVPANRSYFAEFFVIASDRTWAKVVLLRHVDLQESGTIEDVGFMVKWAGPSAMWRVTKGLNVLVEKLDTREIAEAWLKEHKKAA